MRHMTGIFIVIILAIACAGNVPGQQEVMPQMLPVVVDGKWGFIDRTGEFVIKPRFDEIMIFSNGTGKYIWEPRN